MSQDANMSELQELLKLHRMKLFALPNVVGVGLGYKKVGGQSTRALAVMTLVERKMPKEVLLPQHVVPEKVAGLPTDVLEVGTIKPLGLDAWNPSQEDVSPNQGGEGDGAPGELPLEQRRERWRPSPGGVSIGHYAITAGTLGAVVYDADRGSPLILSNNHVLANSTSGRDGRARRGDPILQPGPHDGGTQVDLLARLHRYIPVRTRLARGVLGEVGGATVPGPGQAGPLSLALRALGSKPTRMNFADAALGRPVNPSSLSSSVLQVGTPEGTEQPVLGLKVQKSGRTTGLTWGEIELVDLTVEVYYGEGRVGAFERQFACGPMSQGGDSGSLVLTADHKAVGLLFAGSPSATICSPIEPVLSALKVTLTPGKAAS